MKNIALLISILVLTSCTLTNRDDRVQKINISGSVICDKILVQSIIDVFKKWKTDNDSCGFIELEINHKKDTLIYTISYSNLISGYLLGETPRFLFAIDSITIVATSDFLTQFRVPDSTLHALFKSKFSKQWNFYLEHKWPLIDNIYDTPSTSVLYVNNLFVKKYVHYGTWARPEPIGE